MLRVRKASAKPRLASLPAIMSPRQIAECEEVGLSVGEVRDLIFSGVLPAEPIGKGGRLKVRKVDLLHYLRAPRERSCQGETLARVSNFTPIAARAVRTTSIGQRVDAAASAQLAQESFQKLISNSHGSSKRARQTTARVIHPKLW